MPRISGTGHYWAADTRTDPQPQIHLSFSGPTDLDDLLVTSGAGRDYARLARPKDIQVIYPDGGAEKLTLTDDPRARRMRCTAVRCDRWTPAF